MHGWSFTSSYLYWRRFPFVADHWQCSCLMTFQAILFRRAKFTIRNFWNIWFRFALVFPFICSANNNTHDPCVLARNHCRCLFIFLRHFCFSFPIYSQIFMDKLVYSEPCALFSTGRFSLLSSLAPFSSFYSALECLNESSQIHDDKYFSRNNFRIFILHE